MKKVLVFNWKANPESLGEAVSLADVLNHSFASLSPKYELAVAVPSLYLIPLTQIINKDIKLMAQTVSAIAMGPHTGGVAPVMLKANNLNYSLLGHSEDKKQNKLANSDIALLLQANMKEGVKTILCIGEAMKNDKSSEALQQQLDEVLLPIMTVYSSREIYHSIALAYEPLWAIGSQIEVDLSYVEKQITFIRNYLQNKSLEPLDILYGGSVDKTNIKSLLTLPVLSGVLIGERSSQKDWLEDFLQSML